MRKIEWRYFSASGNSMRLARKLYNKHDVDDGNDIEEKGFSSAVLENIMRVELSPRAANVLRSAGLRPRRIGRIGNYLRMLGIALPLANIFWQNKRMVFYRFLGSLLAIFFEGAYTSLSRANPDEVIEIEQELRSIEEEVLKEGELEGGESEEEGITGIGEELSPERKAYYLTRQFASFLFTSYIVFFAQQYRALIQSENPRDVDKVINKLLAALGFNQLSPELMRYRVHVLNVLRYYLTGDPNFSRMRFIAGQLILSRMIDLITQEVVRGVMERMGVGTAALSKSKRQYSKDMIDEIVTKYEMEDLGLDLENEESEESEGPEGALDEVEGFGHESEFDDFEATLSRVWSRIKITPVAKRFSRLFIEKIQQRITRTYSKKTFYNDLGNMLKQYFKNYYSDQVDEEKIEEAVEQGVSVVEQAEVLGLLQGIEEAAAKAAVLIEEDLKEATEKTPWDKYEEATEDKEKTQEPEEEVEEDVEEEAEEEESGEEEGEEGEEEEQGESRNRLYAKGRKRILKKYRRR